MKYCLLIVLGVQKFLVVLTVGVYVMAATGWADHDGDGQVGFKDFIAFSKAFGKKTTLLDQICGAWILAVYELHNKAYSVPGTLVITREKEDYFAVWQQGGHPQTDQYTEFAVTQGPNNALYLYENRHPRRGEGWIVTVDEYLSDKKRLVIKQVGSSGAVVRWYFSRWQRGTLPTNKPVIKPRHFLEVWDEEKP